MEVRVGPLANVSAPFRSVLERLVHARRPERFHRVSEVVAALDAKAALKAKPASPGVWLLVVPAVFAAVWLLAPSERPVSSGPSLVTQGPVPPIRAPETVLQPPPPMVIATPPGAGPFFDFPSAAEPTLRVTQVGLRWSDARSVLLPGLMGGESLPSGERWALVDLTIRRSGEGLALLRPEHALKIIDGHGVAVPLIFVPMGAPESQFVTGFGLRPGETRQATVAARLRRSDGPFQLSFPDGQTVPIR